MNNYEKFVALQMANISQTTLAFAEKRCAENGARMAREAAGHRGLPLVIEVGDYKENKS